MISDDFLSKTELGQEESATLAMLLAILTSHNSEIALQAAQRLEKLNLRGIQVSRESVENYRLTFEKINSSFNITFSLPIIKLLLNILFISVNREVDKENENYRYEVLQFCANRVYEIWSTSNEIERSQIIPYLAENMPDLKFLTKGVSLAMDEWIKTLSALKAKFILELILATKEIEEGDLKIILNQFVNKFPSDASNDWITCFVLLTRTISLNNFFVEVFKRERLYLSFFDFLYSKKFSVASKDDIDCLIEFLMKGAEDQKFVIYMFSKFTMALGNKIDTSLPFFHPTRLSQCSLLFILSFIEKFSLENDAFLAILKNFLNRLFSLVQLRDFLAFEIFGLLVKNFVNYSHILDQAKSINSFRELCSKVLVPEKTDKTKVELLYRHFLLVPELFLPLDPTLGFNETTIEANLTFIVQNIEKIQGNPVLIENQALVFLSAVFKAFLTKPSQVTAGYIMILLRKPELYIQAFTLLIKTQQQIESQLIIVLLLPLQQ